MKYLLDTNSIRYAFCGEGDVKRCLLVIAPADPGIPVPVADEESADIARLAACARRDVLTRILDGPI